MQASPTLQPLEPPPVYPVRVLLVEDDQLSAEIFSAYLRRIPWAVAELSTAGTLAAALELLAHASFDLVVSDLNLPDSKGAGTVAALAAAGHRLVIAITSDDDPGLRQASLASGAYEFLHKRALKEPALQRLVRLALMQSRALGSVRDGEQELVRFRAALDESADMIAVIDRATMRYVDVNRTLCRMLGYAREELLGMGPQDLLPVPRAALERSYDELIASRGMDSGIRTEYRCKDGARLPFHSKRRAVESGGRWLIVSVARDVRESLAAEGALRESEARFRALTELSSDWYWEQDAELRFVRTAGKSEARGGITPESHLGARRWELPGTEIVGQSWEAHRAALEARQPFRDLVLRRTAEDGSVRYVSVAGRPMYDASGAFQGYHGVASDVTSQKREEALLRLEHAVTRALAEAEHAEAALEAVIHAICEAENWECGRYHAAEDAAGLAKGGFVFPVLAEGRAIGVLSFSVGAARAPDERLLSTMRVIGSQLGLFLQRQSALEAVRESQATHLRHQERIARFGQSALACRDPHELILQAVQQVLEGLVVETVAYLEPAPSGGLEVRAQAGVPQEEAALRPGAAGVSTAPVHGDRGVRGMLCALSRGGTLKPEAANFMDAVAAVLTAGLQRMDSELQLAFLAQFDALTGLPNRALLSDRFAQMIAQAKRHGAQLGVLFVDLDEFKLVNDTLGHAAGDELLKQAAARLREAVREGDTVARISGDEFAVVLADLAHQEDAALVAQKLIDRLAAPFELRGKEVFVTASVGIAVFPGDAGDAEALLSAADAAMYRAKQSGRNAFHFFTAEINQRTRARAQLGTELRRALERDEFALAYQPKYDLASGRPCGAEALLRWSHPERGPVSPAEFVPVLEETGLIVAVGEWVVARACRDLKAWAAAGVQPLPVAVNLSARQFRQSGLDARIRALLEAAGVAPQLIELEITESQLMHDPAQAIRIVQALRAQGMRIAIDDFGTGYSSLAYLTRFPVAALKVDRSFVAGIERHDSDAAIVRTIIEMARTLGFTVIAEGVERAAQVEFLRQLGCHQAQGFYFARPMPAGELLRLMQKAN